MVLEAQEDNTNNKSITTKFCPKCGNKYLILLRTLNIKFCTDCNTEIQWALEYNQEQLR